MASLDHIQNRILWTHDPRRFFTTDPKGTNTASDPGRASHPVSGGAKPHMFLNRIMSKVMSKSLEDTDAGIAGKSLPHCVGLMILFDLRDCNVG